MSSKQQMKRGKNQSLYKYLPETWIDFSVRGKERKQYIAKVLRWNSEKLDGINAKRLIRTVNEAVRSFENQCPTPGPIKPTVGFGAELTKENCDVLTPKASEEERGIVAHISPLTFYCKLCNKIYQFSSEEEYQKRRYCTNPECHHSELAQFRQIYFCKCGYATDRHNPRCPEHGYQHVKWYGNFDFICTKCKRPIPMQVKCPICGDMLRPKVALDPAQFFVFSLSLIDLIDENLENFISETDYGPYITFAYWLGSVSKEELDEIIKNGIVSDPEIYQKVYDKMYQQMLPLGETIAAQAAKIAADQQCGNRFNDVVNNLKTKVFTIGSDLSSIAERILEYDLVTRLDDVSDLDSAVNVARLLNTNANPEQYAQIAERFGIKSARVCDRIPFVSCSYGYTRVESEWKEGVQLHALKEEKNGRKNIYATKLNTEGVLFEFDRKKIIQWLLSNEVINADEAPNLDFEEEIKIWFLNNIKPSLIHPFSTIDETATLDLLDELNEKYGQEQRIAAFSFPMRYIPLSAHERGYVGSQWNAKFLRAVQRMLVPTQGKGVCSRSFFEADFGKSADDFVRFLSMPEKLIAQRGKISPTSRGKSAETEEQFQLRKECWKRDRKKIDKWNALYATLGTEQEDFINLIGDNEYLPEKVLGISSTITYENTKGVSTAQLADKFTVENMVAFANLSNPTGYIFNGWVDINGNTITNTQGLIGNVTITATWTPCEYLLLFNASGGNCSTSQKSVKFETAFGELPTPTRTGYTFDGWYDQSGNKVNSSNVLSSAGNITVYARWEANSYTLTLNLSKDQLQSVPQISASTKAVEYDSSSAINYIPTAEGYAFVGWKTSTGVMLTDADGKICTTSATGYITDGKWCITDKKTLYASWIRTTPNSEIITSTFSTSVYAEGTYIGTANFSVTGVKVKYNETYYIYGNAYYIGTLGTTRFDDVDSIYFKNSFQAVLMGGTLHWRSSYSDNNESGVAGWDKSYGFDVKNICYRVEDPGKDFAANSETITISITDICIAIGGTANDLDGVPEIVTTTLTTDIYCEDSCNSRVTFDLIGVKVQYNGQYYLYGSAFYKNNPNGSRFNDVDKILFKSADKKILLGGTLYWSGSKGDNNESGIAGYNKNWGYNATSIGYMVEDPGKDFAGNEENIISIVGICVQIGENASADTVTPSVSETSFTTTFKCEGTTMGAVTFKVIGFEANYNGVKTIYGNAFYSGNPVGTRFNDVGYLRLYNTSQDVYLGGTVHWYSSQNDNNESGIAGYHNSDSNFNYITYLQEDPGKDFAGNEVTAISITGICVAVDSTQKYYSDGLKYTLNSGSTSYSVTGIGTSTDGNVIIPSKYNGLPVTGIHASAFANCSRLTSITIPTSITSIGSLAFSNCPSLTGITFCGTKEQWTTLVGSTDLYGESPVHFIECTDTGIIVTPNNHINDDTDGYCDVCRTALGCFTGDTLVILADGTTARIDSLKAGDVILSWNAITGEFEAQPISLFWDHGENTYDVIMLTFSNDKTVRLVTEHGFFNATLNKYVYINSLNYAEYIGHEFAWKNEKGVFENVVLTNAEHTKEIVTCYSLRTACNDNAIVEGFLTLTYEDVPGFLTYFEFGENYMYDPIKMQEDIDTYGLYTYDDWKEYVSYEEFVALNGQYLTIAIGKGYLTYDDVLRLIAGMR